MKAQRDLCVQKLVNDSMANISKTVRNIDRTKMRPFSAQTYSDILNASRILLYKLKSPRSKKHPNTKFVGDSKAGLEYLDKKNNFFHFATF